MGGLTNIQLAKNYYSYILSKNMNNYRALWGLCQVLKNLINMKKNDEKDNELYEVFHKLLLICYIYIYSLQD